MRALVYDSYGPPDVLYVDRRPEPTPGLFEVRVHVRAAGLNPKDVLVRKGKFRRITGRRFPRIPGYDLAGVVDAVGPGVRGLHRGQAVYGMLNGWRGGTCAERVVARADEVAPMPAALEWPQAAGLPLAGLTALQALRDLARVRPGWSVLINGASGGVGTLAVQIARALGGRVVGVCSARNRQLVKSLGAAEVIDYATDDPLAPGRTWDVFFDVFGNRSFEDVQPALTAFGRYVTTVPRARNVARDLTTRWRRQKARLVVVKSRSRDLRQLSRWVVAGELSPVVDRVLSLEDGAEAHRYLETKRARGKVIVVPAELGGAWGGETELERPSPGTRDPS